MQVVVALALIQEHTHHVLVEQGVTVVVGLVEQILMV
jgi:hypothetical protein